MIYQNERAIYVKIADRVCDDIQFSPQRFQSLKTDVPHVGFGVWKKQENKKECIKTK